MILSFLIVEKFLVFQTKTYFPLQTLLLPGLLAGFFIIENKDVNTKFIFIRIL
jgi:hypothetical protein